jgi:uncharacterized membrane protein
LVGCNTSPPGGTGGKGTGTGTAAGRSATFTIHAPATSTTIKQGERREVKLKVDRGKDFKENVTLKFEAPAGVKVDPAEVTVKASDPEEVAVNVSAEKDAKLGEQEIHVTGVPQGGGTIPAVAFKVKVEAAGG